MTGSEILIERTPLGTRAALKQDGEISRLLHDFAGDGHPLVGALYRGKVTGLDRRLNAAFVDLGGVEGFLRPTGPLPREGEAILCQIRREPLGGKGADIALAPALRLPCATVTADGDMKPGPSGSPDRLTDGGAGARALYEDMRRAGTVGLAAEVDPALLFVTQLAAMAPGGEIARIAVDDAGLRAALARHVPDGMTEAVPSGSLSQGLDEATEAGLATAHMLTGGGRLTIEETAALVAIDLDLGRAPGQSKAGAGNRLLGEALDSLGRLAPLMGLGGQIVLDVPRGAIASPKIMRDRLTRALKPLGRVSVPAVTPEGVCVAIAPRPRPSLRERLTEPSGDEPLSGRRWRAPVAAARAWHAARAGLEENRTARLTLRLAPRLAAFFPPEGATIGALTERFGPRLTVETVGGLPQNDGYDLHSEEKA